MGVRICLEVQRHRKVHVQAGVKADKESISCRDTSVQWSTEARREAGLQASDPRQISKRPTDRATVGSSRRARRASGGGSPPPPTSRKLSIRPHRSSAPHWHVAHTYLRLRLYRRPICQPEDCLAGLPRLQPQAAPLLPPHQLLLRLHNTESAHRPPRPPAPHLRPIDDCRPLSLGSRAHHFID